MKSLYIFFCSILLAASSVSAHYADRSTLVVSLSDNSPLVVSIDDRNYNKHGRSITIDDLPRGWHRLRVYEYIEYKKGGGHAKLLYSGRIRVKNGTMNYAVLDMNSLRIRMRTVEVEQDYANNEEEQMDMPVENADDAPVSESIQGLKKKVDTKQTDTERLKMMKAELANSKYYTDELRTMLGWLAFESSKLDFAKWSYSKVEDEQNFPSLEAIFLLDESKEEFNQFVSQQ